MRGRVLSWDRGMSSARAAGAVKLLLVLIPLVGVLLPVVILVAMGAAVYAMAASDMFLGWATVQHAKFCGWTLAAAHARSGQAGVLAGYMGKSEALDEAIADFAKAYADQNERDHAALLKAVRSGLLKAIKGK